MLRSGLHVAVRRAHPPSHVSFDGLAATIRRIAPSSPLVDNVVGMERRQLSWQRGGELLDCGPDHQHHNLPGQA